MSKAMTHNSTLHLLCRVGAAQLAFPADQVEAVVRVDEVVPAPGAPSSVRGLAAIRSRLLTLIDCAVIAGEPSSNARYMAIVTVDGHGYGLLLDDVDDVVNLPTSQSLPAKVNSGWQFLSPRLIDVRGRLVLLIEPAQFIAQMSLGVSLAA